VHPMLARLPLLPLCLPIVDVFPKNLCLPLVLFSLSERSFGRRTHLSVLLASLCGARESGFLALAAGTFSLDAIEVVLSLTFPLICWRFFGSGPPYPRLVEGAFIMVFHIAPFFKILSLFSSSGRYRFWENALFRAFFFFGFFYGMCYRISTLPFNCLWSFSMASLWFPIYAFFPLLPPLPSAILSFAQADPLFRYFFFSEVFRVFVAQPGPDLYAFRRLLARLFLAGPWPTFVFQSPVAPRFTDSFFFSFLLVTTFCFALF